MWPRVQQFQRVHFIFNMAAAYLHVCKATNDFHVRDKLNVKAFKPKQSEAIDAALDGNDLCICAAGLR